MTEKAAVFGSKVKKLYIFLIIGILALYFALFAYINFPGFARCAQPDMYEDTLIAKLMWDQKTLFPNGYVFGNQFYVVATPVLAALFYGLTGSMNLGMGIATTVMSALVFIAFMWMLRPAVESRSVRLAAFLVLTACVYSPDAVNSELGQLFFIMCSYYACYLITLLFVFGDYLRARDSAALRPAAFLTALLLSFCTGMQSLRQTCIMTLPLIAFQGLMHIMAYLRDRRLFPEKERAPLIRVCAYFAANIAGVVFSKLLDVPHETIFTEPPHTSRLFAVWRACRSISGFDTVLNTESLLFALMFIFYTGLVILAAVTILRRRKSGPKALYTLWLLCLISIAAVIAASLLTSVTIRNIYLFIYYPLTALSFAVVYENYGHKLRAAMLTALCVLALCNLPASYGTPVSSIRSEEPEPRQLICQYAMDNGYKYIYGQDGSSAAVAAWSDGELIAGMWEHDVVFKVIPYLNIRTIYALDDYDKALFVFNDYELPQVMEEIAGNGAELTEIGRFGDYTVCTSSKQLMYPLTWRDEWPQYFESIEGKK